MQHTNTKEGEQVIQGNRLIAEFDGKLKDSDSDWWRGFDWIIHGSVSFHETTLKYHTSWNWIVPVWKKFSDLNLDDEIYRNNLKAINHAVIHFSFDIVHARIVRAIEFYNTIKNINNDN